MELIERYLHEIGRFLPGNKRADILAELRSTLEDDLESRSAGAPSEADVAAAIKEMGRPQEVAAAYHPEQQYLIGPDLFPLFRMVLGIVLTAVIGAQLVAVLVSLVLTQQPVEFLETFWGILNSLPAALGFVVLTFYILQRLEVKPDLADKEFDPYALPRIDDSEQVNRGEHVVSILAGVAFFVILAWFANQGGFGWSQVNGYFENEILEQYFPWIGLSVLAGIITDVILLWRGRWQVWTRAAHIAVNLFSLGVLYQLIRAHDAWLRAAGYTGSLLGLADLPEIVGEGTQLIGMFGFRIGLTVAALVVSVETVVLLYRLVRSLLRGSSAGKTGLASAS